VVVVVVVVVVVSEDIAIDNNKTGFFNMLYSNISVIRQ
jgi:hypothetical protein